MISRRGLITGLVSFVAAPAIVRAASLMPVKAFDVDAEWEMDCLRFGWAAIKHEGTAIRWVPASDFLLPGTWTVTATSP